MLDISATFDTVDYDAWQEKLSNVFEKRYSIVNRLERAFKPSVLLLTKMLGKA